MQLCRGFLNIARQMWLILHRHITPLSYLSSYLSSSLSSSLFAVLECTGAKIIHRKYYCVVTSTGWMKTLVR